MNAIRALIVDDEPLARERIRALLRDEHDVTVAGECGDGAAAIDAIRRLQPDVVFLDVQMPGIDGFGVIEAIGLDRFPVTVFVTAYDRYAVKAFETHALDYLLKPFDKARFRRALAWVRRQLAAGGAAASRRAMADALDALRKDTCTERLVVREAGRVCFLRTEEIDYCEAQGNYAELHVGSEKHFMRETLCALEKRLEPGRFQRIHRSLIVNLDRVRELQPLCHGDYAVILRDGRQLTLSRTYRSKLEAALGQTLGSSPASGRGEGNDT